MSILPALLLGLAPALAPAQETETITETYEDGSPKVVREVRRGPHGDWVDHGAYKSYHPSGKVESEGAFEDGLRTGEWTFRWERGKRQAVGSFERGLRAGEWTLYDEQGAKSAEGRYLAGHRDGQWTFWNGKEVDEERSGVYGFQRLEEPGGRWWEGETFRRQRVGTWTLHRADGSTMFTGEYAENRAHGPWVFLFADGSGDGGWISGVYEGRWRTGDLRRPPAEILGLELPAPDLARLEPPAVDPAARTLVERFLGGEPDRLEELRRTPRQAFAAALEKLLAYDLAEARGASQSRRLNDELLAALCGATWDWVEGVEPEALRANRQAVLRWYTLWELCGEDSPAWRRDFHPDWQWVPVQRSLTLLARPPVSGRFVPEEVATPPSLAELGGEGSEEPRARALAWIAARQRADGSWGLDTEGGGHDVDTASTALCTLALLGHRPQGHAGPQPDPLEGPYADEILAALRWLVSRQDPESGRFRAGYLEDVYEHALALQAMAEASRRIPLPALRASTQRATTWLAGQRLEAGGWGVAQGVGEGDTVTTAASWLALGAAWEAGAELDPEHLDAPLFWLDARTDGTTGRSYGGPATDLSTRSEGLATAMTVLCHELDGRGVNAPVRAKRVRWIGAASPSEDRSRTTGDPQFLLYGSLAAFQVGGGEWERWNAAVKPLVLAGQRQDGSWPPAEDGRAGSELLDTARFALALEAYWRYAPR